MSSVFPWSLQGELGELSAEKTSTELIERREKKILALWRRCTERGRR